MSAAKSSANDKKYSGLSSSEAVVDNLDVDVN